MDNDYIRSYVYMLLRPVARGSSVGSEEPPSQREVHYLVMKGPLLKNKVHLLKQKVHCYNYTIQGCRNWPGRLGSCQAKVSPTIKNSCD